MPVLWISQGQCIHCKIKIGLLGIGYIFQPSRVVCLTIFLHAMALMVLLLVGWVIRTINNNNNHNLPQLVFEFNEIVVYSFDVFGSNTPHICLQEFKMKDAVSCLWNMRGNQTLTNCSGSCFWLSIYEFCFFCLQPPLSSLLFLLFLLSYMQIWTRHISSNLFPVGFYFPVSHSTRL